jgi:GLEYA domain/F5/8 type C domain
VFNRISAFAGPISPRNNQYFVYRYFRFTVTKVRDITQDPTYPVGMMQMTEFELLFAGTRVSYSGATATNQGGFNPTNQEPSKAIDGNTSTVFLDMSGNGTVSSNATGVIKSWVLQIDFGSQRAIDGYRYMTGADVPGRDPVQWILEGSNDNSTWTTIQRQDTDATITASRTTYTQNFYVIRNLSPYQAGIYRTTYSGYMGSLTDTLDNVNFFDTATAVSASVQTNIIQDPAADDGTDFSRQWLGYFVPNTTETYTFYLKSDDCSWMWVGSNAVSGYTRANATVNNGGLHGFNETSGTISLVSGTYYTIRVQFGEHTGGDQLDLNYSTPTITKTTDLTGRIFYHPATRGF